MRRHRGPAVLLGSAPGALIRGALRGALAEDGACRALPALSDAPPLAIGRMGCPGASSECRGLMRRLGPWLVVGDDTACGGLTVTVRGLDRRAPWRGSSAPLHPARKSRP
jgi:hypothetical protein